MAEREISEFPAAEDFDASSILHTKDQTDLSDRQATVQELIDLVPTPEISPEQTTEYDGEQDDVVVARAPDFELERIPFDLFTQALGVATVGGDVQSGHFNISGLHIRWGNVDSTTDSQEAFTFSEPFPNQCFGLVTTRQISGGASSGEAHLSYNAVTVNGFTLQRDGTIDGTAPFFYIAIGR